MNRGTVNPGCRSAKVPSRREVGNTYSSRVHLFLFPIRGMDKVRRKGLSVFYTSQRLQLWLARLFFRPSPGPEMKAAAIPYLIASTRQECLHFDGFPWGWKRRLHETSHKGVDQCS